MRRHALPLAALLLAACGGGPATRTTTSAPTPPDPSEAAALAARGTPGHLPYRLLVVAGDGVDEVELFGVYYGMTALGWRATIAAPGSAAPVRGAGGRAVPVDEAVADIDPVKYDVLYVPGGAPVTGATAPLVRRFLDEATLATTAAGAEALAAAGVDLGGRLAGDDAMVRIDGNVLSAARPGDVPGLVHALDTYAQDRLRQARAAGGGTPP